MAGYKLSMIARDFTPVEQAHDESPIATVDLEKVLSPTYRETLDKHYGTQDFAEVIHEMPAHVLLKLGIEGCAKAIMSAKFLMEREVRESLDDDVTLALVSKIKSSMWRWGLKAAGWNDIVGALNGIANFTLDRDDFTITLDWSRKVSPKGYSTTNGTWLDGVFGFFVHWKGEHVMTIGFSIVGGRKILLQQVQATSTNGNRWMFKLPQNRLEHIIECFHKAFSGYEIYIADGRDYTAESMKDYREALQAHQRHDLDERESEAIDRLTNKIQKLARDKPRIVEFYRNVGRYTLGEKLTINQLRHYKIEDNA